MASLKFGSLSGLLFNVSIGRFICSTDTPATGIEYITDEIAQNIILRSFDANTLFPNLGSRFLFEQKEKKLIILKIQKPHLSF